MTESCNRPKRSFVFSVAGIAAAAVLGLSPGAVPAARAQSLESVKFLLDFTPYGKHTPWFAAIDKGFYKDAGFNVTIIKGEGSATTVAAYSAGAVDFAFADTAPVVIARTKGAKIKVAAMIHDKSLYAFGTLVENKINGPQDFKGKKIGSSVGDATRTIFPAFAERNNLKLTDVNWVDMTPPARAASLVLGRVDIVVLYMTEEPTFAAKAKEAGKTFKALPLADYGIDLYNNGMLVSDEMIAKNPQRAKRFIEASMKAWAWSIEHPDEALAIFLKHNPAVDPVQAKAHFRIAVDHLMTDRAKKFGIGYMDPAKMKETVEFVSKYFKITGVAPESVYTNQFLPKLFPKQVKF